MIRPDPFADVEQGAFNPANVVPGISFSPDKMLQGRLFSYGDTLHYEPNGYGQWQEQPGYRNPPEAVGNVADCWNFRDDDKDYYGQPGVLFRNMNSEQQMALFMNTAHALTGVPREIQERWIEHCAAADPKYGEGVAEAVESLR